MKILLLVSVLAGSLFVSFDAAPATPAIQNPQNPQDPQAAMAEMMAKAKKFTQPGEHHALLARFVGKWDTELRMMMGGQAAPPSKGSVEYSWLMEGRWLQSHSTGEMMGMPLTMNSWLGYDNFKQSYVTTMVSSMDTAMNHAEGDLAPDGKALLLYGTVDEYLTGEHDKMVKYAWRFVDDDTMKLEVHDLPIGEQHTMVVEVTYRRAK